MTIKSKVDRANIHNRPDDIKDLIVELKKTSVSNKWLLNNARLTERVCAGRLNDGLDGDVYGRDDTKRTVTHNIQDNLVRTLSALLVKNLPSAYAVPVDTRDPLIVKSADITTKIIEYKEREEKTASKWHEVAKNAVTHGTGFMKVVWSDALQKTIWMPLSVFNVIIENAANSDDVQWAIIDTIIGEWDAIEAIQKKNPSYDQMPKLTSYDDSNGQTWKGVLKTEIYFLPGARFPTGLYATVIDEQVCEAMEYPYIFQDTQTKLKAMLPLSWFSIRSVRNNSYGRTPAFQTNASQITLDFLTQKSVVNSLNAQNIFMIHESLSSPDLLAGDNVVLSYNDAQAEHAMAAGFKQTYPVDAGVERQISLIPDRMRDTFGITQSTTGDVKASQSGTAIAYAAELDNDKNSDAVKSLRDAVLRTWELDLQMERTFRKDPFTLPISGEDPRIFFMAEIASPKLDLQGRSELASSQADKLKVAKEDVLNGFKGPEALAQIAPTPELAAQRGTVQRILEEFLATKVANITLDTAPPQLVEEEIDRFITASVMKQDIESVQLLIQLKTDYRNQIAAEQQGPPANAGGGDAGIPPKNETAPLPEQVAQDLLPKQ